MIDHPDMHEPAMPQQKLVLPAVPVAQPPPDVYSDPRLQVPGVYSDPRMQAPPEMLIRHNAPPPRSPLAKLVYFWRKDPAYKVLMIAVAMVVIAGLLLTTFVTSTVLHGFSAAGPVVQNPVATTQPVGTVDNRPAFPTPGGGTGSTVTSQPPMQSTPILQPTTPPIQPTPSPPASGTLSLQITNIPNHVRNNTSVDVGVNTNEANISVSLVILYSSFPYRGTAGPVTTDNNGNANVRWFVFINAFSNRMITASVYAVARDQNGQIVRSQPATVQISVQGGGGGM
ncbi:MAG: hypothetical protein ACYDER_02345 [Ktedonobacteraceae bacterium]